LSGRLDQISTLGLHNATLYDVLQDNQGTGNVTVNAATMDVSCYLIPNGVASVNNANGANWTIKASYNNYFLSVDVPLIGEAIPAFSLCFRKKTS